MMKSDNPAKLPYSFDDRKCNVVMHRHDLPAPWINYLSNGTMHAFVSQAGGGFCWWKSPTMFRLTRYRWFHLPLDTPGFYVYIRQPDGTVWSPTFLPSQTPLDQWEARHGPGYSTFTARKGSLEAVLTLFVAQDSDTLVMDVTVKNHGREVVDLDVFGYVELGELNWVYEQHWAYYGKFWVTTWHSDPDDAILYLYQNAHPPEQLNRWPLVYFASTHRSASWSGDRDVFVGDYRDERNPVALEKNNCGNNGIQGGEGCGAIQVKVSVAPSAEQRLAFFLGAIPGVHADYPGTLAKVTSTLADLRRPGAVQAQREKLDAWWTEHLDVLQCKTPEPDATRHINIWLPVQGVHTARYSRSVSQSAGGMRALGFRDTCQDMLAQAYRKPEWAERVFVYLMSNQFQDGSVAHKMYMEDFTPPGKLAASDNHLWPHLVADALLRETGDLKLLDRQVPYLADDCNGPVGGGSLWEHLEKALDFTESHLGAHGIPLTMKCDWNDNIGSWSRRGRGETVMVAQQYVVALRLMIAWAHARGDQSSVTKLTKRLDKQLAAILACAWDGQWWRRAFDDDGNPIGTASATSGKIWINAQSWAVLANMAERTRLVQGMDSARKWLDTPVGLRINAPGYPTWPESSDPGLIGLPRGVAENSAIFSQTIAWVVMAEALLGRGNIAWEYWLKLVPHRVIQAVGIDRYKAEAYAHVSHIFGPENVKFGFGSVAQVTATAAWMDVAATQYLLGVYPEISGLKLDPCLVDSWPGVEVLRTFRGCRLDITIDNKAGVQKGVKAVELDGKTVDISAGPFIPAAKLAGRSRAKIRVTMGV